VNQVYIFPSRARENVKSIFINQIRNVQRLLILILKQVLVRKIFNYKIQVKGLHEICYTNCCTRNLHIRMLCRIAVSIINWFVMFAGSVI
jgi:hypothetical protein